MQFHPVIADPDIALSGREICRIHDMLEVSVESGSVVVDLKTASRKSLFFIVEQSVFRTSKRSILGYAMPSSANEAARDSLLCRFHSWKEQPVKESKNRMKFQKCKVDKK